jgi:hypothetical protein
VARRETWYPKPVARLVVAILVAVGCGDDGGPAGPDAGQPDAVARALGDPCEDPADCASGACTDLLGQAAELHCSAECDAVDTACPEGGVCLVPGAFAGVCVRPCTPTGPACPATLTCALVDGTSSGCH